MLCIKMLRYVDVMYEDVTNVDVMYKDITVCRCIGSYRCYVCR